MSNKQFDTESRLLAGLFGVYDVGHCVVRDPKEVFGSREETGADAILDLNGLIVGVQITELDAGEGSRCVGRGETRRNEKRLAKEAAVSGKPNAYGSSAPAAPHLAIPAAIKRKQLKRVDKSKFAEAWLLISANTNEWGATGSTFVAPELLDVEVLDQWTSDILEKSQFGRVFLHLLITHTLYEWRPSTGWKLVYQRGKKPNEQRVRELRERLFPRRNG